MVPPVAYARRVSGSSCAACAGVKVIISMRFTLRFPFRTYSGETGNEGKRNWKRSPLFRFLLGKNGNAQETVFLKSGNEKALFVSSRFHKMLRRSCFVEGVFPPGDCEPSGTLGFLCHL